MHSPLSSLTVSLVHLVLVLTDHLEQPGARTITKKESNTGVKGDRKLVFPMWPVLKGATSRADKSVTSQPESSPDEATLKDSTQSNLSRNYFSVKGRNARKVETKRSIRRKASTPESYSSPMTTVQEACLDSRKYCSLESHTIAHKV